MIDCCRGGLAPTSCSQVSSEVGRRVVSVRESLPMAARQFTEAARVVVVVAEQEARLLGHPHVGTEHLLLGALGQQQGVAARALAALGIEMPKARAEVIRLRSGSGEELPRAACPLTPRATKALDGALVEAERGDAEHVDTEHVLLGVLDVSDGTAIRVLKALGTDPDAVRESVAATPRGQNETPKQNRASTGPWTVYAPRSE